MIDGVLADFATVFAQVADRPIDENSRQGERLRPETTDARAAAEATHDNEFTDEALPVTRLSRRQQRLVWKKSRSTPNFWTTLQPVEPGLIRRIDELATRHRWEVFFVTKRPATAGDTVQRQTQRWLVQHGFVLPSVLVTAGSRGKVADALDLDFLVDDTVQHCVNVIAESMAKPILIRPEEDVATEKTAKRLGIAVCRSVAESLDLLDRATELKSRPSFLRRVREVIGR